MKCPNELPVLFVSQDKSGTMADPPDPSCPSCPSKWSTAKGAVSTLAQNYANRFRFGVQMFPHDTTTFNCTTGTTVTPFPASSDAINVSYASAAPGGGTPTAVSLDAAASYLKGLKLTMPAYVLLLTDGLPNCNLALDPATCAPSQPACANASGVGSANCGAKGCLDDQGAKAAAARLLAAGYKVYVVGFDGSASANVNKTVLDTVAKAGGTTSAYAANDSASLEAALDAIAFNATTCCKDVCTNGASQCTSSGQLQRCQLDAQGECTNWTLSTCPGKAICTNGSCVSCNDECAAGAVQCASGNAMSCEMQSTGCTAWIQKEVCNWGELCKAGVCQSCSGCNSGDQRCSGQTQTQTCELDLFSGCSDWVTDACASGSICRTTTCESCSQTCQAGQKRCTGKTPETCGVDVHGCTNWTAGAPCVDFCSGGVCGACGTNCTVGAARCNGNTIESCTTDDNSCTVWTANGPCLAGQYCTAGSCSTCPVTCTTGQKQCGANGILECQLQPTGCNDWVATTSCNNGELCQDGQCIPPCQSECQAGALKCDTKGGPMKCAKAPSGCLVWKAAAPCVTGDKCLSGVCRTACSGTEIETCPEGFVCTGLPEGNYCLPGDRSSDAGVGTTGTLEVPEDPTSDPGAHPKPGKSTLSTAPGGCGCASATTPGLLALAPLLLGLARRRRPV